MEIQGMKIRLPIRIRKCKIYARENTQDENKFRKSENRTMQFFGPKSPNYTL